MTMLPGPRFPRLRASTKALPANDLRCSHQIGCLGRERDRPRLAVQQENPMSRHFAALSCSAWATLLISTVSTAEPGWPPALPGANAGTATLRAKQFLEIPANVQEARSKQGAADFVMAKSLSTLELAYHGDLGPDAANRRLWSCW